MQTQKAKKAADKEAKKKGTDCSDTLSDRTHVKSAKYDEGGNCNVSCKNGYERTDQNTCVPNAETMRKEECEELRKNIYASHKVDIAKTALKITGDFANVVTTAAAGYFNPEAGMAAANASGQIAGGKYSEKEKAAKIIEGCQKYYEGDAREPSTTIDLPQTKKAEEPLQLTSAKAGQLGPDKIDPSKFGQIKELSTKAAEAERIGPDKIDVSDEALKAITDKFIHKEE